MTEAELLSDQAIVFSDFPTETVTISGSTYNALVMDQDKGNDYDEGGKTNNVTIRLAIERSAINSAIPAQGTTATFNSTDYRIGEVDQGDTGASIVITLENLTLR